jgi:HK97 family phage prohead protease
MSGISYKNTGIGIKNVDVKKGIVQGYFSNFNSKDSDGDIIMPGAFTKTLLENGPNSAKPRIKHLLNHRTDQPLGRLEVLVEDANGLYYESQIGQHTLGKDFLLMVEDGLITEHSIGFKIIKDDMREEANYISELQLWEGSSLTAWGANENTPLVGVKSMDFETLGERMNRIVKGLRNGSYSDEAFEMLEIELLQVQKAFKELSAKAVEQEQQPVVKTTEAIVNPQAEAIEIINQFKNSFKLN